MSCQSRQWIRAAVPALLAVVAVAAACAGKPASEAPRGHGVVVTVSGLAGEGLVLQVNGADDLPVPASGTYRFQRGFAGGDAWVVTVAQHPTLPSQFCEVAGGEGTIAATDAKGAQVACYSAWKQVSAGYEFNVGVRADGTLWAWGTNAPRLLGEATIDPVQVGTDTGWMEVTAGQDHMLALRSDGTLWGWGQNFGGQLGDGTKTARPAPVQIGTEARWARVATGGYWSDNHDDVGHTVAVKTDGTLWAWGDNRAGQLGNGTYVASLEPLQVGTATDWARVWAGPRHSLAQKRDGTLWAWGWNRDGQLGVGCTDPVAVPSSLGPETSWTEVAPGAAHTVALRRDGTLWAWGDNSNGALGVPATVSTCAPTRVGQESVWRAVAANGRVQSNAYFVSFDQTFAVKSDGTLWAWGTSVFDGPGVAYHDAVAVPAQVGTEVEWAMPVAGSMHVLGLRRDGTLRRRGIGAHGAVTGPTQVGAATDWAAIATGAAHALALRADGSLWAWGTGQLGNGATSRVSGPVQVGPGATWSVIAAGAGHSLAVRRDGSLWSWGHGVDGELATTATAHLVPVQIGASYGAVAAGGGFSLGRLTDGTLSSWGYGGGGALGTGTTASSSTPVPEIGGHFATWASVSAGAAHVLALTASRELRAWGSNASGKLGLGASAAATVLSPAPIAGTWSAVSAGGEHSLAIRSDGTLWAWGANALGQLGTGAGSVSQNVDPLQVGSLAGWASVSAGHGHSLGLRADGTLWAWGGNGTGELGIRQASTGPAWAPVQVSAEGDWAAIAAGRGYSLASKRDGTLWAWGVNDAGQLGNGPFVRVP